MGQHMTQRLSSVRRLRPRARSAFVSASISASMLLLASSSSAAQAQSLGYAPPEQRAFVPARPETTAPLSGRQAMNIPVSDVH